MSRRIERASNSAATATVSAPPATSRTNNSISIADQLCQQLTESVTVLESHARELRVARVCQRNQTAHNRLAQLGESLTAMEERAQTLVDIVNAEHDALQTVQAQHQVAKEHHQYLLALQENMLRNNDIRNGSRDDDKEPSSTAVSAPSTPPVVQEPARPHTAAVAPPRAHVPSTTQHEEPERNENRGHTNGLNESETPNTGKKNMRHDHRDQFVANNQQQRLSNDHPARRNNQPQKKMSPQQQQQHHHHHHHHHAVELRGPEEPITLKELEQIPRTTRGRISLYVLNDALSDIAAHCRRARRRQKKKPQSVVLSNSYSQQQQQQQTEDDVCVVGEQELRQSCSFFRTGESTARSILLILRTLGRLQQIPAKNGEVTYIVASHWSCRG